MGAMERALFVFGIALALAACSGGTIRKVDGGAGSGGATGAAGAAGAAGAHAGMTGTAGASAGATGTAGAAGATGAAGSDGGAGAGVDAGSDAARDATSDGDAPASDDASDAAADVPGDASGDVSSDATDAGVADVVEVAPPKIVTVTFAGQVVTVAGTPLGFDATARLEAVSGSFSYDLRMMDQQLSDTARGTYEGFGLTTFTCTVKGHTVTGSGSAQPQVENLNPDTFRFRDGKFDLIPRTMKLDGTASPTLGLTIAITDASGVMLTSDKLPDPFPTIDIKNLPHTFSLSDSGGTMLMQLDTIASQ
jgi:hypothetical protein